MPPAVSIPLARGGLRAALPDLRLPLRPGLAAGFFAGYLVYDMMHYYLHHFRPRGRLGRMLRERHMRHHFQDDTKRLRHQRALLGRGVPHLAARTAILAISGHATGSGTGWAAPPAGTSRLRGLPDGCATGRATQAKGRAAVAATNINRVVLTGNLTPDPELRSLPSGIVGLQAARRVQHAPQERQHRRMGGQAQLLRRQGLGRAGRERGAIPVQGPPGRDRGAPGVARVGGPGRAKRQAVDIIADSVQFLGSRDDASGGGGFVGGTGAQGQRRPGRRAGLPDRTGRRRSRRRRHSVLARQRGL